MHRTLDVVAQSQTLDSLAQPGSGELLPFFVGAVALSLILPRLPYGRNLLYPFSLLGTWAHELGHGLFAMMAGGSFERLEIYSNLGGQARFSGVRRLGTAFTAFGGLLGPAIAGGLIIVLGSRESFAPWVIVGLAIAIVASVVFFVRNLFGFAILIVVAAALIGVATVAPFWTTMFVTQLIGIQFCLASWGSLDYMFTKHFERDGYLIASDTQQIAEVLVLPYWFWGAVVALSSATILAGSFYLAWIWGAA